MISFHLIRYYSMHHVHGSGTLNANKEDLDKIFTQELVDRSIKTQKEMIKKAIKILKPGGELIYSTCSILKEENEKIVKEILKPENIEIVPIDKEMFKGEIKFLPASIEGTICLMPDALYEGFFVAKLRKKN